MRERKRKEGSSGKLLQAAENLNEVCRMEGGNLAKRSTLARCLVRPAKGRRTTHRPPQAPPHPKSILDLPPRIFSFSFPSPLAPYAMSALNSLCGPAGDLSLGPPMLGGRLTCLPVSPALESSCVRVGRKCRYIFIFSCGVCKP